MVFSIRLRQILVRLGILLLKQLSFALLLGANTSKAVHFLLASQRKVALVIFYFIFMLLLKLN